MPEQRRRRRDRAAEGDRTVEQKVAAWEEMPLLSIEQLGWSPEDAAAIRASLASFAADWDHPSMAIYDGIQAR